VLTYYVRRFTVMTFFALLQGFLRGSALDEVVINFLSNFALLRFLAGYVVSDGPTFLASLWFHLPKFAKQGTGRLPRVLRALRGWSKLSPAQTRPLPPWALVVAWAVAAEALMPCMGLAILVAHDAYLRPSECRALRVQDPVAPQRELGPGFQFFSLFVRPDPNSELGWGWVGPTKTNEVWKQLMVSSSREDTFTPYTLRLSGPSHDKATGSRSLEEVQKRGNGMHLSSRRRYEKLSRVQAELERLPAVPRRHCLVIVEVLEKFMKNPLAAPVRPNLQMRGLA
jgi:hypothetical protein